MSDRHAAATLAGAARLASPSAPGRAPRPPVRLMAALLAALLLALAACSDDPAADGGNGDPAATGGTDTASDTTSNPAPSPDPAPPPRLLIFSRAEGFRHASIADGVALIQAIAAEQGFEVTATEDPAAFNDTGLAPLDAVIWLNTTHDVLDDPHQAAFERFIQAGGGYVGIHSAADTEYGWPWYGQLLGGDAWFDSHPAIQQATLTVVDDTHPSTSHLPASFSFTEEWYNFQNDPTPSVNVLLTIDEASYDPGPGAMGASHPVAWYHEFDGGRAWYTNLGHSPSTYGDAAFQAHLLGGIRWVLGLAP